MTKERFIEILEAVRRSLVRPPQQFLKPKRGLNPFRLFDTIKFKVEQYIKEPNLFKPFGTLIFCGSQGEGKTLSAVDYIKGILKQYPYAILCSNTQIKERPFNAYIDHIRHTDEEWHRLYDEVKEERRAAFFDDLIETLKEDFYRLEYPTTTVEDYVSCNLPFYYFNEDDDFLDFKTTEEWILKDILSDELITQESILSGKHKNVTVQYWGLDTLKYINNGRLGVVFFIDEIHLELNSLESKNVPVEVMVEISQQRKQRKHIVGTSQRYNRMAKPLREQIRDVVDCKCYFGVLQFNKYIDGDSTREVNGETVFDTRSRYFFFHSPDMYESYDTYVKMRRYNNEWQGRPQISQIGVDLIE